MEASDHEDNEEVSDNKRKLKAAEKSTSQAKVKTHIERAKIGKLVRILRLFVHYFI